MNTPHRDGFQNPAMKPRILNRSPREISISINFQHFLKGGKQMYKVFTCPSCGCHNLNFAQTKIGTVVDLQQDGPVPCVTLSEEGSETIFSCANGGCDWSADDIFEIMDHAS